MKLQFGHRGRHLATAVAVMLTLAAAVLVLLGARAQVHAAAPPASAAHPTAEGNLPAPPTPAKTTGKRAPRAGHTAAEPSSPSTPAVVGPVLARSTPIALTIPAIGIHHSHLAAYGTDTHGAIDIPPATGGVPAGWYTGSPTPGQPGPSVIVGHTDAAKDGRSIFFRLGQLRPGDHIEVTLADHTVAVFTVDSLEAYPKKHFPTARVYGNINHAGLRLISCTGKFDPTWGHYLDNLVVYAHLTGNHRT
ncbi:MAG TPA: class F sortase [Segeticoccus sp.]|uniref:class F sortase n=1 Tax=Segeticoccus sp. TaxID=2706531 RepID=UPI002D7E504B|nr:class F sortase [Segeticoccus sp.]HET8599726.1 class F sortase [Segeticoccus sp.]